MVLVTIIENRRMGVYRDIILKKSTARDQKDSSSFW